MKKLISLILSLILLTSTCAVILTGCETTGGSDDRISIITTIFPEYDWVNQILGDRADQAEVTLLLDSGVDLHSYQPTADDIIKIAACDMFIYVGGESDDWVDDILAQAQNKDMVVINLFDVLGDAIKEEEVPDGMEHEHEDDHDHEDKDDDHGHVHENDEHVWLSLRNAQTICRAITDKLCLIDPDNAETYTANTEAYCAELKTLDAAYAAAVDAAPVKTLLFGDRFPFRYLVDDYGIEYFAAFSGCSAESEASFETIAFLAGKVDELGLTSVIKLKGSDDRIAQTIIDTSEAKNANILTLDSLQTTTSRDAKNGTTYLAVMKSNLEVLKAALQ